MIKQKDTTPETISLDLMNGKSSVILSISSIYKKPATAKYQKENFFFNPPLLSILALILITSCTPPQQPTPTWLLHESTPPHWWTTAAIPDQGPIHLQHGILTIADGAPMSAAKFTPSWTDLQLPIKAYHLQFEARRTEGQDFFATCTFPVGSLDLHLSLVLGGWGGGLVGISNIDHYDASMNETRAEMAFINNQWYRIQLSVSSDHIRVTIDERLFINTSLKGRHLSLRSGDIDHCLPLGFATWRSTGQIRNLSIRPQ